MLNDLECRRGLTFAQAEGLAPLPTQLRRTELTARLRSVMWSNIHSLAHLNEYGERCNWLSPRWYELLRQFHVSHLCQAEDDFTGEYTLLTIKRLLLEGGYADFYGAIQFLLQHSAFDDDSVWLIGITLERELSAFRIIERTLVPVGSQYEADNLRSAFQLAEAAGQTGSRAHLAAAAKSLGAGNFTESIKESISAVEAVSRTLTGGPKKLSEALSVLESDGAIHPSLKVAFKSLYGYTSDEPGLRHALLSQSEANVDEADGLLMIGLCSAFVTYVLSKHRPLAHADKRRSVAKK